MNKVFALTAVAAFLGLSACGDSTAQRAVIGGAIGCAAGEVLANGRCVEGAVVGAGVGVITE
ncbi:hypothetical protein [Tateyamaria omphalii]|uniref:YMGG-like Gly-zipper domain-containing protein n=1 Tax=Tateyamaria omphalii TaxID=299262 RepID=A0A1P8MVM7_9RHOB|nr:hypothetical protein [Tateyamaria omphalii]APX12052.1 hypothetical protein BWR18_10450 [Tateyamaria omphalii]